MNPISLTGIKDLATVQALTRLETELAKLAPFAKYEYVNVTFSATANGDTEVTHTLAPRDPEAVDYHVMRIDRAGRVYHDESATRRAWQTNYIVLRCDSTSAVATVLLTIRPS